jgi:hypothetical protein
MLRAWQNPGMRGNDLPPRVCQLGCECHAGHGCQQNHAGHAVCGSIWKASSALLSASCGPPQYLKTMATPFTQPAGQREGEGGREEGRVLQQGAARDHPPSRLPSHLLRTMES